MITALPVVRNNRTLAEEVASITLINIMEYAKRNDDNVNNPSAWVYEIAKNAAYRLIAKENVYNAGRFWRDVTDLIDNWMQIVEQEFDHNND